MRPKLELSYILVDYSGRMRYIQFYLSKNAFAQQMELSIRRSNRCDMRTDVTGLDGCNNSSSIQGPLSVNKIEYLADHQRNRQAIY